MKQRDAALDLVRGVSALAVMLGHLRAFLLVDFGGVPAPGLLTKVFYFATGLGHEAVMVFFVLSGYFVGGSVLAGLGKGSFRWGGYAAARLTRLWMVLFPALILTLAADWVGQRANPAAYAGGLNHVFKSGPTPVEPAALGPLAFLGNLFFVQTVAVPVYGSNGPLWSLANEFWYYLVFPLLAVSVWRLTRRTHRKPDVQRPPGPPLLAAFSSSSLLSSVACRLSSVVCLLSSALLLFWLPRPLVLAGVVWLMGVGVWWMLEWTRGGDQRSQSQDRGRGFCWWMGWAMRGWPLRVVGGVAFLGTLAAARAGHWFGSDCALGGAFAVWMLSLTGSWRRAGWMRRIATGLSEISYTLYVVHFPLLFLFAAAVLKGRQFQPDAGGLAVFAALAAGVLLAAIGMWWFFERNTDRVRKMVWKAR